MPMKRIIFHFIGGLLGDYFVSVRTEKVEVIPVGVTELLLQCLPVFSLVKGVIGFKPFFRGRADVEAQFVEGIFVYSQSIGVKCLLVYPGKCRIGERAYPFQVLCKTDLADYSITGRSSGIRTPSGW